MTRRCSFASVIDTTCELPNRCLRPRATCDWTPAGNATNRCVSERLETVREDHPLPAVIWVYAAFPFSGRTSRRRYDEAPALDTSRHRAMGPASAETPTKPATTAITRSKGPSNDAPSAKRYTSRQPEAPSIESSNLACGFDWRLGAPKRTLCPRYLLHRWRPSIRRDGQPHGSIGEDIRPAPLAASLPSPQ